MKRTVSFAASRNNTKHRRWITATGLGLFVWAGTTVLQADESPSIRGWRNDGSGRFDSITAGPTDPARTTSRNNLRRMWYYARATSPTFAPTRW